MNNHRFSGSFRVLRLRCNKRLEKALAFLSQFSDLLVHGLGGKESTEIEKGAVVKNVVIVLALLGASLIGLAGVFVTVIGVGLYSAYDLTQEAHSDVFKLIERCDAKAFLADLELQPGQRHSEPAVMQAWMSALNQKHGKFVGISNSNFHTRSGGGMTEYETTSLFENGSLETRLTFRDAKLVGYSINGFDFGPQQLKEHLDQTEYLEETVVFAKALCNGDYESVTKSMLDELIEECPASKFTEFHDQIKNVLGDLQNAEVTEHDVIETRTGARLVVDVRCAMTGGEMDVKCTYALVDGRLDLAEFTFDGALPAR